MRSSASAAAMPRWKKAAFSGLGAELREHGIVEQERILHVVEVGYDIPVRRTRLGLEDELVQPGGSGQPVVAEPACQLVIAAAAAQHVCRGVARYRVGER